MTDRSSGTPAPLAEVPWTLLEPYYSVSIVQYTGEAPDLACQQIVKALQDSGRRNTSSTLEIVAATDSVTKDKPKGLLSNTNLDEVSGFVVKLTTRPAWAKAADYLDQKHLLTVIVRRGRLLAIQAMGPLRDRLEKWLESTPRPQFDKLQPTTLERCILQGEAKGLWLRGTHAQRPTKPSSKQLSGVGVQDALNSSDASFALSAGRARIPDDATRVALVGTAGATPEKSIVWLKRASGWSDFAAITDELFDLLEAEIAAPSEERSTFSMLAREVHDASRVRGAFDVSVVAPENLPAMEDTGEQLRRAAEILDNAIFDIRADRSGTGFELDVGANGAITGTVGAQLHKARHGFRLSFGPRGTPGIMGTTREIIDALTDHQSELLTIYYSSGHTLTAGRLWTRNVRVQPFPNWQFEDFSGFDITQEKPPGNPQQVHERVGSSKDQSLFGWVLKNYQEGSLICDDGSGEIADFLHVDPSGLLSLIHVKAAGTKSHLRKTAASKYEVVVGQATKNLIYASDPERLAERIGQPPVANPGCWENGRTRTGREDFIESLQLRDPTNKVEVVIVQPHMHEAAYRRLREDDTARELYQEDFLRLCLLETMLNEARANAISHDAELRVVACGSAQSAL